MRFFRGISTFVLISFLTFAWSISKAGGQDYSGQEDPNKKILKSGLLGAGVGAISAEASGGKAGTGALVGAGTNVIGGALLDTLTSSPQPQRAVYQQAPVYVQQPQYAQSYDQQPVYAQHPVYYQQPPAEDPNKKNH